LTATTAVARRCRIVSVAAFVVAFAVVAGCGATSNSTADRARDPGAARDNGSASLSLHGLTLTVPAGWDSESFLNPSGLSVFRVGSFAFPHRPDDDVGQIARQWGPTDVLVNIVDFTAVDSREGSPYTPVTPPLAVDGSQATPQEGYTVPAAIVRSVRIHGHKLYLSVAFGSAPPSPAQVAAANAVLQTLTTP
jgi:hypothetical protein